MTERHYPRFWGGGESAEQARIAALELVLGLIASQPMAEEMTARADIEHAYAAVIKCAREALLQGDVR
jgi:hypothetical protein